MTALRLSGGAQGTTVPSILDSEFSYTPAVKTDVTRTWARFGWTPPDREKQRETMLRLNPFNSKENPCPLN